MRRTTIIFLLIAFFSAAGTASAATGDPRVCAAGTPAAQSNHAFWCAKTAATAAVRKTMASRQHQTRWFYPVFCDEHGSLLRWSCKTIGGGDTWTAVVAFGQAKSGWRVKVTVTP